MGFCHLTDSHHYHHGQKPTMVGICHGGNMPVGHDYDTNTDRSNGNDEENEPDADVDFKG